MRTGMGWMFRELCMWKVGGTSGYTTFQKEIENPRQNSRRQNYSQ
jgi:hypothetical protein